MRAQLRFQMCHCSSAIEHSIQNIFLLGWDDRAPTRRDGLPRQHGSWLASQGIYILAQVVFSSVMRMNGDGAAMAQEKP